MASDTNPRNAQAIFALEFRKYAALRKLSDEDLYPLVRHIAASPTVISNWRRGRTDTPLEAIPIISQALGMGGDSTGAPNQTYILQKMGLLDVTQSGNIASVAFNVQRLELRFRALQNELALADRASGVAQIARIARDSGEWGVAIWPIIAGPLACRMHVEDRIDLRHVSGKRIDNSMVFDSPLWHDILRRTHAVPGKLPSKWTANDMGLSSWVISHARSPTLPRVRLPHPKVHSAAVYGINLDSGANEVAKLVSVALGYGLTLTRDEAIELMGIPAWLGATEWEPRSRAHQSHLDAPPPAVVWAHHAPPHSKANIDPFKITRSDVPIYWLRESTALFKEYCERWDLATVEKLTAHRRHVEELALTHRHVSIFDVDSTSNEDLKWKRNIEVARSILHQKEMRSAVDIASPNWNEYSNSDPDISKPFLSWIESQ
ncbi:hypothetical protein ACXR2T_09245 [Leucobacter sp. HY1910]